MLRLVAKTFSGRMALVASFDKEKKKEDSCLCTYIGKIILRKNNSDLPQDLSSFVLVLSKYTKFLKNDTRN